MKCAKDEAQRMIEDAAARAKRAEDQLLLMQREPRRELAGVVSESPESSATVSFAAGSNLADIRQIFAE